MARKELTLEPRTVTGKKVARLRRAGILPGNIFGRHLQSVAVQVETSALIKLLRASTKNEVIDLKLAGERTPRPAIVQHLSRDPLDGSPLHADFYQVSLREKMRADVPLVLVGSSEAVSTYNGVLTQQTDVLHIEALPLDIPAHIEVDISKLKELDSSIHVSDLNVPPTVTVLTPPDVVVAQVTAPRVEEVEEVEEAPEEAPEAVEEAAPSAEEKPGEE
ncbi:MAG TPA: 50S ribosomal protein L25 [Dehalococcoidia bacterium]|nr:50S ribosomal protein L25 [Dehalococcoidia bacterium]